MPTIINPYKSGGQSMGDDLFGLGGIADTFFGPKASQSAYTREKFREAARQNEFLPQYAAAAANNADPREIARLAIMAGQTGQDVGNYGRYVTANTNPNDLAGNRVTAALVGAGGPYGSSPQGFNATLANQKATQDAQTERLILADELKADRTPVTVRDPTSPIGIKTILMSEFRANPGKYTIVPTQDILKAGMASQLFSAGAGASPFPAPGAPPTPIADLMTTPMPSLPGMPSVPMAAPPVSAAPGGVPSTMAQVPAPLQHWLGMEPKTNKGQNYSIVNEYGEEIDGGITTDGGMTDITGKPIVVPEGARRKLIDAANPSVGTLGSPGKAVGDIRESRTATSIAINGIDNVITNLGKPGSDAALGIVGRGASLINNVRAQVDSLGAAAKDLGYAKHVDLFSQGADRYLAANPALLDWAQKRGIDSGILKSQISSLGYLIARANNQQGALGVHDVEDAMTEIGANIYDPKAFAAVLANVKTRLQQQQKIREVETARTVSRQTGKALGLPQPDATGGGTGAPARSVDDLVNQYATPPAQ